ncbi:hypothetical protein LSAT2_031512 [Lamellibrachia satsuma]|nr:hypothetical protein LSAT2_031512 [Lamellibrachia satsuma]
MEKSGGCQHMQCRCGFQFCWECLSAWQDHGPYLTCPTTHVKLTVLELDNTMDVQISEWYFRLAKQHREASRLRTYNSLSVRITGFINRQKIITLNKRMRTRQRSDQSQSIQQIDSKLHSLKTINKFIVQMHKFLESTCVLLAACDRKTRNRCLEQKVSLLEFLLKRMQEVLISPSHQQFKRFFRRTSVITLYLFYDSPINPQPRTKLKVDVA